MILLGLVVAVGPTSSLSTVFTINVLKSLLYKHCAWLISESTGDNKDSTYIIRVIEITHSNDVSVKYT
jgi:hypothetical protein